MKQFDLDWAALLRSLPAWEGLDILARRALLDTLKPSGTVVTRALGDQLDALQESGIVEATATRAAVAEPMRPFVRALRAMDRHRDLLRRPNVANLIRYLEEHFTADELNAVQSGSRAGYGYGWVDRNEVARHVASVDWIEEFLALDGKRDAKQWEDARRLDVQRPLIQSRDVFEATQQLLRLLVENRDGVPLRHLPAALGGMAPLRLGVALHAALRYLLCFAVLDPDTLEPRVGVWPPVAERFGESAPAPPEPVEPVETFHAALAMEDMTAILVAASGEPLRLRGSDYEIFARQQQAIAEQLVAVPGWMADGLELDPDGRIPVAAHLLRVFKLVTTFGEEGRDLRLDVTRKGAKWLTLSARDRLATLLDSLRTSKQRNPGNWLYEGEPYPFFPQRISVTLRDPYDARAALSETFLSIPPDAFVPVDTFLDYHAREGNPFLEKKKGRWVAPDVGYGGHRLARREEWEAVWKTLLEGFLVMRLAMLGGARIGRDPEGRICFSLTGAGRYLLGGADDFDYGHDVEAEVIVQPNFEIVFLAPAPPVEAQFARLAQRVGSGPGVMFRLTRDSVLAAAEAGLSLDHVLGTLRQASTRELPANVERQIRDWYAAVRRVSVRHTVLIRCPDAETAARVREAGGDNLRPLTDTVLEMTDSASPVKKALLRRLRKSGVFLEG